LSTAPKLLVKKTSFSETLGHSCIMQYHSNKKLIQMLLVVTKAKH